MHQRAFWRKRLPVHEGNDGPGPQLVPSDLWGGDVHQGGLGKEP